MNQTSSPRASRMVGKAILNIALLALTIAPSSAAGPGKKPEPAKDHPLVGRYEGSVLVLHRHSKFDSVTLLKGPVKSYRDPDVQQLEGAVSFYYYQLPEERSMLEVQRNFESSLQAKGFETAFSCSSTDGSCFQDKSDKGAILFGMLINAATNWPSSNDVGYISNACNDKGGRYLLARRNDGNGEAHVSIALCETAVQKNFALVAVVESQTMDTDKISFLDASAMQKSLNETGRVNLYGIYFDTDKDVVKPESKPTLDEIAKMMRDNPQLRLRVAGHTDSTGNDAHNKDLSNRRAASVIRALNQAGIDNKRFAPHGAGASEPVAPNDSEAGRSKNRRVELVRM